MEMGKVIKRLKLQYAMQGRKVIHKACSHAHKEIEDNAPEQINNIG